MSTSITRLVRPRRPLWLRIILWILVFVLVLLVIAAAVGTFFVMRAQPTTNGNAKLVGLSANVSVVRDKNGIPHITAATEDDLFMAQGYVHAQDRLFQMELFRRAASGRLSEFAGTATQNSDEIMRAVGLRRTAQKEYEAMTADQRKPVDNYAKGVNAFIDSHKDALPLEFLILGFSPEPWSAVDSLAIGRQVPWTLSGNFGEELLDCDLVAKFGPQRAQELIPDAPASITGTVELTPTTGSDANLHNNSNWATAPACGSAKGSLATFYKAAQANPLLQHYEWLGSNDWVIDGSKSTTGKPMLANDPHLGLRNPNIWYEIHLATADGKLDVAGFSFAGIPGVVVGHNQSIAWGVTNVGPDVQDLFLEKLDPAHPGQYQYKGQWVNYDIVTETIKIKGGPDDVLPVRITVHGPIITDVMTATETSKLQPMALDWVGNQQDGLFGAVQGVDRAQNWEQFRAALKGWAQAGQNFVYADKDGNIGYQATGKVPVRAKGDDGMLPVEGWTGAHDWNEYVPFEQLPMLYNPSTHYVATANFRPYAHDYQLFLGARYETPWRVTRIREMIDAKDKLSQADMEAIQHDQHSVQARGFGAKLAALHSNDAAVQQAIDRFKNWDGSMAGDSPAAAIYELTYLQMLQLTFKDDLSKDDPDSKLFKEYINTDGGAAGLWMYENLDNPQASWWDDVTTADKKESRDDIMLKSITNAVGQLNQKLGGDQASWRWDKLHTITFAHPLGSVKPLNLVFNFGPYAVGGDGTTVNVSPFDQWDAMTKDSYAQDWVPSYRAVYDLTDWNSTHIVMPTGESGVTGTSHVNDQTPLWLGSGYLNFPFDRAAVDAAKDGTLTLTP